MRAHAIYLAVIAILVVAVAVAVAKAVRARRQVEEIEEQFSLTGPTRVSVARPEPLRELTAAAILKPRTYAQYRREVDALVDRAVALGEFGPADSGLGKACAKALAGGRRLRSIIVLEVARARQEAIDAAEAALFVEYLHCASLVVDDLPAFDNDTVRRGRPTLHADVGQGPAQLAALGLLAAAYQNIGRQMDWLREHNETRAGKVDRIGMMLCGEVSRGLGVFGAAGGQYRDIAGADAGEDQDSDAQDSKRKTASFFEIATVTGWLVAGGSYHQLTAVREAGARVGTAFQIADDIGDMAQDARRVAEGRPGKNYANEYGPEVAVLELERNLRGAQLLLKQTGLWTPLWADIFERIRAGPKTKEPSGEVRPMDPPEPHPAQAQSASQAQPAQQAQQDAQAT